MARNPPTITSCAVSLAGLASLELFSVGGMDEHIAIRLIVDLDCKHSVEAAERALTGMPPPTGAVLRIAVRLPQAQRLVFEGEVPAGQRAAPTAISMMAWVVERLISEHV